MNIDPTALGNFVLVATAFAAAFLAALWLSLIIWTYRDIRKRARDPLIRILAALVVAVLFLPGMLVYLILRPSAHPGGGIPAAPSKKKPCSNPSKTIRSAPAARAAFMKIGWPAPAATPV